MFNRTILLLTILTTVLLIAATSANAADTLYPEQVVAEFQKMPHNEMFCRDSDWGARAEPIKIGEKFKKYLSKELYKLFLWSSCVEPEVPPHYDGMNNDFSYDIRFGISYMDVYIEKTYLAKDILIRLPKHQSKDKAIVNVNFNYGSTKMFTSYTLIREDGQWKIDDIAPQADYIKNPKNEKEYWHNENTLDHSDSIKIDMQNNYRAAEKRYQEEQSQKH